MEVFSKEKALDDINEIMANAAGGKMSIMMKCMADVQDYLQKLHDNAFEAGFEKGCDATKKIEAL